MNSPTVMVSRSAKIEPGEDGYRSRGQQSDWPQRNALAASRIMFDDFALARAIHVLALVHWIGGLSAVTTIVLPRARALPNPTDAVAAFEVFERRFARQVRVY